MEKWDAYDSNFKKIDGKILIRGEEKDIPDGVYLNISRRGSY